MENIEFIILWFLVNVSGVFCRFGRVCWRRFVYYELWTCGFNNALSLFLVCAVSCKALGAVDGCIVLKYAFYSYVGHRVYGVVLTSEVFVMDRAVKT